MMEEYSEEIRELDRLYNESEQLFSRFAHSYGISSCAHWVLYDIVVAGGSVALSSLTSEWSYSKQTVNSALKTLKERGLIDVRFVEGSRKNKMATLTKTGSAFAERCIYPAMQAEKRAFDALAPAERETFLRLMRTYTDNLAGELTRALEESKI